MDSSFEQHVDRDPSQPNAFDMAENSSTTLAGELAANRNRRAKLFRLANTIHHDPNDVEALAEYVDLVLEPFAEGANEVLAETLERCDQMEGFLLDQARQVDPGRVDDILELADSLDATRTSVMEAAELGPEEPVPSEDQETVDTLQTWLAEGTPLDVPPEPEAVGQALQQARNVRSLLKAHGEPDALNNLNDRIQRLQTAQEVDRLLSQTEDAVDAALAEEQVTEAAYILQTAEQTVRQLVIRRGDVSKSRKSKINDLTRRLEETSATISRRSQRRDDQRRWSRMQDEHKDLIKAFWFTIPRVPSTVKNHLGTFTKRIKQGESLLQILNQTLSQLHTEEFRQKAIESVENANNRLDKLQRRRHKTYNKYALHRIRKAMKEGKKTTGVLGNRKRLSVQIVSWLGQIDRRHLTNEVSRAYSEVFELLYGELSKAKSEKDFNEKGTKLHVLKKMSAKKPSRITEF